MYEHRMNPKARVERRAWTRGNRPNFNLKMHYTHTDWYHMNYKVKAAIEEDYNVEYNTSQGYFLSRK